MSERAERGRAVAALASLVLVGCPDTSCPPGSHLEAERCVLDADAGGSSDASLADAGRDACILVGVYVDADGDGHGDPARAEMRCRVEPGYSFAHDDCDDAEASVFPGATELCDGTDQDCDGGVDEGIQVPIGTRIDVDTDARVAPVDVGAVGESYVVAWHSSGGVAVRRLTAAGAPLSITSGLSDQVSDPLLRVVPVDALHAFVVYTRGTSSPYSVQAAHLTVNTDPIQVDVARELGVTISPFSAAVLYTTSLSVLLNPAGTGITARIFDDSLSPLTAELTTTRSATAMRALFSTPAGAILSIETDSETGRSFEAYTLAADSFDELGHVTIGDVGVGSLTQRDAHGRLYSIATGPEGIGVLRYTMDGLATSPVPVVREPITLGGAVGAAPPDTSVSDAGLDLVVAVSDGSSSQISWQQLPTSGGVSAAMIDVAEAIPFLSVARISSREGAIVYVRQQGGSTTLSMQRIGCE